MRDWFTSGLGHVMRMATSNSPRADRAPLAHVYSDIHVSISHVHQIVLNGMIRCAYCVQSLCNGHLASAAAPRALNLSNTSATKCSLFTLLDQRNQIRAARTTTLTSLALLTFRAPTTEHIVHSTYNAAIL